MKNFAELVSRTSKHSTLKVRFHPSDFFSCQYNIITAYPVVVLLLHFYALFVKMTAHNDSNRMN